MSNRSPHLPWPPVSLEDLRPITAREHAVARTVIAKVLALIAWRDGHPVSLNPAIDLPAGSETTLFAISRVAGWVAHASEQLESKKLIRPRARYTGPAPGPLRKR